MKKTSALLLAIAMLWGLLSGCGSGSTPEVPAPETNTAASSAPISKDVASAIEKEMPATTESAVESAAEDTNDYEPQINFPGSDTAQLHYSNTYTLPISEEGATITWMRNQLNLMGPLGELGLDTLQDLDAIKELQNRTGITIEYTELDFWTAQEKMNIALASGDYPALISDLSYTGGNLGALEDGIIVDLTDMLPELSPNYQYLIDSNPEIAPIFRNDGKVLCYQSPYENFVENQGWMSRDWRFPQLMTRCLKR